MEYRADIDGLRAIAALSVVGAHARFIPGRAGPVGVDIFFVISGFLISGIILRALESDRFSLLEFYARRVRRIFPALITVLVSTFAIGWLLLLPDEFQRLGLDIATGAAFAQNIYQYTWAQELFIPKGNFEHYLLGHLWSLGVEEQFYLVWPVLLIASANFGRTALLTISAVFFVSLILHSESIGRDMWAAYFLPWNRLWQLAIGGFIAYLSLQGSWHKGLTFPFSAKSTACNFAGLVGGILILDSITGVALPARWATVSATFGTALVISSGSQGYVNRVLLTQRPLVLIGLISYPLYLWHLPLLHMSNVMHFQWHTPPTARAAAVATTFLLAFLTYKYVELPYRSNPHLKTVALRLLAAMMLVGISGYMAATHTIPPRSNSQNMHRLVDAASEDWRPINPTRSTTDGSTDIINLGSGKPRVLFIGDNTIQQHIRRIEGILSGQTRSGHAAIFATREWCAPGAIDLMHGTFTEDFRNSCKAFIASSISLASTPDIDTVVIGAGWYFYFTNIPSFDHFGSEGELKVGIVEALDTLEKIIVTLTSAGKKVYLVLDGPIGASCDPRQMISRKFQWPGLTASIPPAPKKTDIMRAIHPVSSVLIKLAQRAGADVIDPLQILCDDKICPVVESNGAPIYRDMWNLRPSYIARHVPLFDDLLADAPHGP